MTITHGTESGYSWHGCRCDECRAGRAARVRERKAGILRAERKPQPKRPLPDHGSTGRYARGCRCDKCRFANAERAREYRTNRRTEAGLPPAARRRTVPTPCTRTHADAVLDLLEARARALTVTAAAGARSRAGAEAKTRRAEVRELLAALTAAGVTR